MSINNYKAQAQRLGDHLQSVHGVKLKHASLLQAIADIHGYRDWNTLSAKANTPSVGTRVKLALGLGPRAATYREDGQTLLDPMCRNYSQNYLLAKTLDGQRPLVLTEEDLTSHVLLCGTPGSGSSLAVDTLLSQAIAQGSNFLIIDGKGDNSQQQRIMQMMPASRSETLDVLTWGAADQPQLNLSLCEESNQGALADLLWEVLFRTPSLAELLSKSTDLEKEQAFKQWSNWIFSAQTHGAATTLSTLAQHCEEHRASLTSVDPLSAALVDALHQLAPTGSAPLVDLVNCLHLNRNTYLKLPLIDGNPHHATLVRLIVHLLHRATGASTSRPKKPFIVVLRIPNLYSVLWRTQRIYAELGEYNISLVIEAPQCSPANLDEGHRAANLLKNTAVKLFFRQNTEKFNQVLAHAANFGVPLSQLNNLAIGECFMSTREAPARRVHIVPLACLNETGNT